MKIHHVSNSVWSKSSCKAKTKCPIEIMKQTKVKDNTPKFKDKYISPEKYKELLNEYNQKVNNEQKILSQ